MRHRRLVALVLVCGATSTASAGGFAIPEMGARRTEASTTMPPSNITGSGENHIITATFEASFGRLGAR